MAKQKNRPFSDRFDAFRKAAQAIHDRKANGKPVSDSEVNNVLCMGDTLLTEMQDSELPMAHAMGKRIRGLFRSRLGWKISKRGRPLRVLSGGRKSHVPPAIVRDVPIKTKRVRKTKVKVTPPETSGGEPTQPTADETITGSDNVVA
jgi:hypothetical protein